MFAMFVSCLRHVALSASRVGHLRFTFTPPSSPSSSSPSSSPPTYTPYILIQSSRSHILRTPASPHYNSSLSLTDPSNLAYPTGSTHINPLTLSMSGQTSERQDAILTPISNQEKAKGFKAYYYAKFDGGGVSAEASSSSSTSSRTMQRPMAPPPPQLQFHTWGTAHNTSLSPRSLSLSGPLTSGYVVFPPTSGTFAVSLRVGVSFISISQAAKNVREEVPDGATLEETRRGVEGGWRRVVGRVGVGLEGKGGEGEGEGEGGEEDKEGEEMKKVLLTAVSRTLQVREAASTFCVTLYSLFPLLYSRLLSSAPSSFVIRV